MMMHHVTESPLSLQSLTTTNSLVFNIKAGEAINDRLRKGLLRKCIIQACKRLFFPQE